MKHRLNQMERLRHLRSLKEKKHEAELARATHRAITLQRKITDERDAMLVMASMTETALAEGAAADRLFAEQLTAIAEVSVTRLCGLHRSASEVVAEAKKKLVASRQETEQAALLRDGLWQQIRIEEERREQAVSDDRFAARKDWAMRRESLKAR